jgi:hypothetical protein
LSTLARASDGRIDAQHAFGVQFASPDRSKHTMNGEPIQPRFDAVRRLDKRVIAQSR